ncbi:MAG TPA: 30S ribosomal protein S9, partial [Parcubacteria group bacterium]|nr:30S ribosomal protein S9 [Parcubacteria group bacterium]
MEKTKSEKYIETVGRRKTSVARVRLIPSTKTTFDINGKDLHEYFTIKDMQDIVKQPLVDNPEKFKVTAKIVGGGIHSQSEAM